jgi:hypothetical protein
MLIATPLDTSALMTIHADCSWFGLIRWAFFSSISAVIRDNAIAYSLIASPLIL